MSGIKMCGVFSHSACNDKHFEAKIVEDVGGQLNGFGESIQEHCGPVRLFRVDLRPRELRRHFYNRGKDPNTKKMVLVEIWGENEKVQNEVDGKETMKATTFIDNVLDVFKLMGVLIEEQQATEIARVEVIHKV